LRRSISRRVSAPTYARLNLDFSSLQSMRIKTLINYGSTAHAANYQWAASSSAGVRYRTPPRDGELVSCGYPGEALDPEHLTGSAGFGGIFYTHVSITGRAVWRRKENIADAHVALTHAEGACEWRAAYGNLMSGVSSSACGEFAPNPSRGMVWYVLFRHFNEGYSVFHHQPVLQVVGNADDGHRSIALFRTDWVATGAPPSWGTELINPAPPAAALNALIAGWQSGVRLANPDAPQMLRIIADGRMAGGGGRASIFSQVGQTAGLVEGPVQDVFVNPAVNDLGAGDHAAIFIPFSRPQSERMCGRYFAVVGFELPAPGASPSRADDLFVRQRLTDYFGVNWAASGQQAPTTDTSLPA